MAGGSQDLELDEAAGLLGVSTAQLSQRIEAGDLPEAVEIDEGAVLIPRDQLPAIAQREGWIIDLRVDGDHPSPEFSEMLERLLDVGQQLITETSARKVAEAELARATDDLAAARRSSIALESVIEELEAENVRLGKDLTDAEATVQISDALANERFETILDLQASAEQAQQAHLAELEHHRRQQHDLRDRIERAQAAMGWWSRRRYRNG
jgi:hypothetical protein